MSAALFTKQVRACPRLACRPCSQAVGGSESGNTNDDHKKMRMETRKSKRYKTVKITDAFQSVKPKKRAQTKKSVNTAKVEVSTTTNNDLDQKRRSENLNCLRQFDMNWEFGPCIGITRLERWERAKKLGLDPPTYIRALILKNRGDENYTQCVWSHYKVL